MRVSELSGALLDLWVARAEGEVLSTAKPEFGRYWLTQGKYGSVKECPRYSTQWADGGPIIARDRIEITPWEDGNGAVNWVATAFERRARSILWWERSQWGPTPLVAAMRCRVISKFGDEVPDEVPA